MDNRDMPAMPVPIEFSTYIHPNRLAVGFSKREHIAAMAMQGILSNKDVSHHADGVAAYAVEYADALLKQLEESE